MLPGGPVGDRASSIFLLAWPDRGVWHIWPSSCALSYGTARRSARCRCSRNTQLRFPDALEVVNAVFDGTRQPFVAATADSSEGFAGSRELDRGRFETSNLLPRRNSNEIRTASSISSAEIKPDACVSFFLGSRKNAAAPSTTISLSHVGSPLLSNDEWGIERLHSHPQTWRGGLRCGLPGDRPRAQSQGRGQAAQASSAYLGTGRHRFSGRGPHAGGARPLGDRAGLRRRPARKTGVAMSYPNMSAARTSVSGSTGARDWRKRRLPSWCARSRVPCTTRMGLVLCTVISNPRTS